MIQNGMCFILDSKYYSYSALETEDDENREESVNGSIPGSDSIQKQITYAEFIDNSIDNNNLYVRSNKFRFQPDKFSMSLLFRQTMVQNFLTIKVMQYPNGKTIPRIITMSMLLL